MARVLTASTALTASTVALESPLTARPTEQAPLGPATLALRGEAAHHMHNLPSPRR
jgi:hypothetical protein